MSISIRYDSMVDGVGDSVGIAIRMFSQYGITRNLHNQNMVDHVTTILANLGITEYRIGSFRVIYFPNKEDAILFKMAIS